ncbi:hypothetical protein QQ020_00530 [Fulvivirgaceae bacterium BMA12]|uniref:Uncharacterized protein n=1 Tax=Agaribacillus aureus TaxID=3051825 RepID=A0ABT8KYC6_9BACT|nr:hypothetical protein [Fulvivirgaceae bacterium BMA12]
MKKAILTLIVFASFNSLIAQETEVDASKPTNLYTQINTLLEHQNPESRDNIYGTRLNIQYTFNPDNLLLVELPILYNSATEKFGLSDMRMRYFYAARRNLTKAIIAIAPFVDVTLPIGKFEDGLGSSSWTLSAGTVIGIILTQKIALFPGVGYVHVTEPEDFDGKAQNGINIQTNMSISFSQRAFVFINPIVNILDEMLWSGEFNFNYMAKPNKLKLNLGYFPLFTQDVHTLRSGATFYF